jgi:predicted acylesterase/phospholipase RssA
MKKKTRYFKNCLGVFQGGGCKALAFVGAYKEAVERGVFFSGVAGTSAGAIVAAMIAAGASPDELESAVLNTDFSSFKQVPRDAPAPADAGWARYFLRCSWNENHRQVAKLLRYLGLFSSQKIEEWLENQLRSVLGFSELRAVRFKDLNIPLHVVATDLRGAKPIIWSSDTTPDISVAYAVRCSCTIPGYFQAVDSSFVDGGIVSNLPAFVLNGRSSVQFEKLLCFTFASEKDAPEHSNDKGTPLIEDYVKSLISSAIDGAVHIQTELQPNLHVIEIGSLPLGTVDFEKVCKESVQQMAFVGQDSAARFFDAEISHIRSAGASRPVLHTETETLNQIVREELNRGDKVIFSLKSTRYTYNLFPTFLHWSTTGVRITYLCEPAPRSGWAGEHEPFQRLVLTALGVRVVEVSALPFEGVLFSRQGGLEDMIVLDELRKDDNAACFGVKYDKTFDAAAIISMHRQLTDCIPSMTSAYDHLETKVTIEKGGLDELFRRLKMVREYAPAHVTLGLEEVDIDKIVFLTNHDPLARPRR